MKTIGKLLAGAALIFATGFALDKALLEDQRIVGNYLATKTENYFVEKGKGYESVALQFKEKYSQLKNVDVRVIVSELKKLNNDMPLVYGKNELKTPYLPKN